MLPNFPSHGMLKSTAKVQFFIYTAKYNSHITHSYEIEKMICGCELFVEVGEESGNVGDEDVGGVEQWAIGDEVGEFNKADNIVYAG